MRVNYQDQLYRISAINILTKMIKLENTENVVTVPLSEIEKNILKFIVSMCSGKNIIIDQRITSKRIII